MSNPLVSILLPTYNQASFAEEAISSAAEQDYPNLEVVVSDDGSVDETTDIIFQCARKYPGRVKVLDEKSHLGITGNCNRILKNCSGEYISFHAGDDIYLQGKIRKQVEWLEEHKDKVLCGHDVEVFLSTTGETLYRWSDKYPLGNGKGVRFLVRNRFIHCYLSSMVRKACIPDYGFDERISYNSDWKMLFDCLAPDKNYGYIDEVLAKYRIHDNNITTNRALKNDYCRGDILALDIVEDQYPALKNDCRYAKSNTYFYFGMVNLERGDLKFARNGFINAILHNVPGIKKIKSCLGLILSFLPSFVRNYVMIRFTDIK